MPDYDDATYIELGKLALQVGNDPKTRRDFFKAVKQVAPERYARQADQVMQDKIDELTDKIENDKIERRNEEIRIRTEASRGALKSRYSEEDITKIDKLMVDLGIGDYERAARIYAAELPALPSNTTPKSSGKWELPTFEGLLKDPIGAARAEAHRVIDELNRGKR